MGKGGAGLMLVMLFMAVTSTGSAEQIAVSSLYAYDVYREYINPNATGKQVRKLSCPQLIWVSVLCAALRFRSLAGCNPVLLFACPCKFCYMCRCSCQPPSLTM